LLRQAKKAGIHVRFLVLDRGFYSVAVIRYLQAARTPFLIRASAHL
jgi:putative transposase